jgi:hypothetical protein
MKDEVMEGKVPKLTRVLIKDLKGRREVSLKHRKKSKQQYSENTKQYNTPVDHAKYMPKIPVRQEPKKPTWHMRTKKERCKYTVRLKDRKEIPCTKVLIQDDKITLIRNSMRMEIPCGDIKWIKEQRARLLMLARQDNE